MNNHADHAEPAEDRLPDALRAAMAALTAYQHNLLAGATREQLEDTVMACFNGHQVPDALLACTALTLHACQLAAAIAGEPVEGALQGLALSLAGGLGEQPPDGRCAPR